MNNTSTCGVTTSDQQTCESRGLKAWQGCPNLIDSKFIQPNKHKTQNLLDEKVL